ncbi:MAG TPA: hypothetical protein VF745_07410, partial [Steroidobacteraceae bacterium]
EDLPVGALQPRRHLTAIKSSQGKFPGTSCVSLTIESTVDRRGELRMFHPQLECFPAAAGTNKYRHLHLL